jgi:hypothetical protein
MHYILAGGREVYAAVYSASGSGETINKRNIPLAIENMIFRGYGMNIFAHPSFTMYNV